MPRPSKRTRSEKRVSKSLPGGGSGIHYKLEATTLQRCQICNQPLAGIRHMSALGASKLNRSKKRISRSYGGQICHNCLKTSLKQAARII